MVALVLWSALSGLAFMFGNMATTTFREEHEVGAFLLAWLCLTVAVVAIGFAAVALP